MKYLFLDIDGVLNHEMWYKDNIIFHKDKFKKWWESCFDPDCVDRLNNILRKTGARLVVSSSWRHDLDLKTYFETFNITTDFDITPSIHGADRGEEIDLFLKNHPCDNYAILDDDMDFTEDQLKKHFVHCCADLIQAFKECHPGETGLTDRKMRETIKILNG